MRVRGSFFLAVAAALLVAVPAPAATITLKAKDNYFTPSLRVITVGDTIKWRNDGALGHTVSSFPGAPVAFDSSPDYNGGCDDGNPLTEEDCLASGATFEVTFNQVGVYDYVCKAHGTTDQAPTAEGDQAEPCGMCGRIDVRAASGPPKPSTTPTLTRRPTTAPSVVQSPSPTATTTAGPTDEPQPGPTGDGEPIAAPRGDEGGGSGRALVALLAIGLLSGAGFFTWRRFLATR